MNKVIKDQLLKVRSTSIKFDDNTTKLVIPRTKEVVPTILNEGDICIIELEDFIINPQSNSTLASNWNAGKIPKYKQYKVEFIEKMGNMYKFNGIAYNNGEDLYNESWFGWFPENGFKILERWCYK